MAKLEKRISLGFTIVELLIVVVVIAILAAITIVAYNGIATRANDSSAKSTISTIIKKIEIEKVNNQTYPSTLSNLGGSTITANSDTRVEYTSDTTSYCLTVSSIRAKADYYQSNTTGAVAAGKCSGHGGYIAGAGMVTGGSSIFGSSAPTGTYGIYNDGGGNLWVGNRFYTSLNNGIKILGARVWEPASATAPFLAAPLSAQLYTHDWTNTVMGGWNNLGSVQTSATFSGTRVAGTWTYIWFPTPVTIAKAAASTGTQDFTTIGVRYDGNYYIANTTLPITYIESNQVPGVYLSEDGNSGRGVNNLSPTLQFGTYYGIDILFTPI